MHVQSNAGALPRYFAFALTAVTLALLGACAGPSYPTCKTDDHCKTHNEYCLDGKCAQCRVDSNCPNASGDVCVTCLKGACGRKPDCCTAKLDCGSGQKCESNKCVAECSADRDCASGQKCNAKGACVAASVADRTSDGCSSDSDCGGDLRCEKGMCVDAKGQCQTVAVPFDFNENSLTAKAQDLLTANYKCMKVRKLHALTIEGHCDERGTDAYNLELGARRAKVVKAYLQQLDPKFKLKTISYGKAKPVCNEENEDCFAKNRQAQMPQIH